MHVHQGPETPYGGHRRGDRLEALMQDTGRSEPWQVELGRAEPWQADKAAVDDDGNWHGTHLSGADEDGPRAVILCSGHLCFVEADFLEHP